MHFLRKLDNDCQKQSKRRCEKINLDMSNLFFIFSLDKSPYFGHLSLSETCNETLSMDTVKRLMQ